MYYGFEWKLLCTEANANIVWTHTVFKWRYKRHWYFPGTWMLDTCSHKHNHFIKKNGTIYLFGLESETGKIISSESNPSDPILWCNVPLKVGFFIKNFTIDLMASWNSVYNFISIRVQRNAFHRDLKLYSLWKWTISQKCL